MINIILNGCNGKMGRVITNIVEKDDNCKIVAGFDINDYLKNDYPVYTDISKCTQKADVIIDFSHPSALTPLMEYAKNNKIPIVVATTGLDENKKDELKKASEEIPVFFSANMSLGVNLLINLAKKAAVLLEDDFDIEIIEKHHNQKIDAPSGTALMIADEISQSLPTHYQYTYDRHASHIKRIKNEIGIHSVRGGTIVGEHEVIFAGNNEMISIAHNAQSRDLFASGAVRAAKFLIDKQPALYSMKELIDEIN